MGFAVQTTRVSPELETAAARVADLVTADQLQLFEWLRERLGGSVAETNADQVAQRRSDALKVIDQVAVHLGKPGEMPTPAQFDEIAALIAPDWDRSKVIRAWRKWRFAKDAYVRGVVRTTTEGRKLQSIVGTSKARSSEVYLAFVQMWLKTNPPRTFKRDYEVWAKKYNDSLKPGDDPAPSVYRLYSKLQTTWADIVRVAQGEITLDQARPTQARDRQSVCEGPHDLVSIAEIQAMLETTRPTANATTRKAGFPVPVFSTARLRLWMRVDVEAFLDGKAFPKRVEDEIGDEYLGVAEVAEHLGVSPVSVASYSVRHLPRPNVNLGGVRLWHVSVVEETLEKRAHRGRLVKGGAPAAKFPKSSG